MNSRSIMPSDRYKNKWIRLLKNKVKQRYSEGAIKKIRSKLCTNILIALPFFPLQANFAWENTNIAVYDRENRLADFNRLRWQTILEYEPGPEISATIEIDNNNYYSFEDSANRNDTRLYRGYLEYGGARHLWIMGRQRVPFGVGRIWNPIDVFNPINTFSIEPYEREGVDALHYEYATGTLGNLDLTFTEDKYAGRFKTFYRLADFGLVGIMDQENELDIAGWEVAGEFMDTGVELRSEGGLFRDGAADRSYFDYVFGAEYGFVNSLTMLGEYRYNGNTGRQYLGGSTSYQPTMLYTLYLRGVVSLDDSSFFLAPTLDYSLSDEMTLTIGALVFEGGTWDEFGSEPDRFYLRWFIHF